MAFKQLARAPSPSSRRSRLANRSSNPSTRPSSLATRSSIPVSDTQIGRLGGLKSRRALDGQTARDMVRVREAKRAFRRFRTTCFWSYRPDLPIGLGDVPWVAEQLRKHGNRAAWRAAARLCP